MGRRGNRLILWNFVIIAGQCRVNHSPLNFLYSSNEWKGCVLNLSLFSTFCKLFIILFCWRFYYIVCLLLLTKYFINYEMLITIKSMEYNWKGWRGENTINVDHCENDDRFSLILSFLHSVLFVVSLTLLHEIVKFNVQLVDIFANFAAKKQFQKYKAFSFSCSCCFFVLFW